MGVAEIAIILTITSFLTLALLHYYGNYKTSQWYSIVTGFISWVFPISVIFILPLDLSSYLYFSNCLDPSANYTFSNHTDGGTFTAFDPATNTTIVCDEPIGYMDKVFFLWFWRVFYWIMFCLCWFWIPVMQSWLRSGEFRFLPKMWDAWKENLIYYAALGVAGAAALAYIFFTGFANQDNGQETFWDFLMAGANAWGLFLITISMGYGLVELPREIWNNADTNRRLTYLQYRAPKLKEEVVDIESELYEVARDIAYANRKVPSTPDGPLRNYMDVVLSKLVSTQPDDRTNTSSDERPEKIDEKYIVSLHFRVKRAEKMYYKNQSRYRLLLQEAFLLQDVVNNRSSSDRKFKSTFINPPDDKFRDLKLSFYWWYHVHIYPTLMKIVSLVCLSATLVILWSESTFQYSVYPPLSVPAFILRNQDTGYVALEFVSICFTIYMATCAYFSLFKVRYFDYLIVPRGSSDEGSLLFIGSYLCKLTFPLCYNFLNLVTDPMTVGANSVFIEYQKKSASMTPLLGDNYDTWLPLVILIFCLLTFFNLHGYLFRLFRIKGVVYRAKGNEDSINEGRVLLEQERSLEERRVHRTTTSGGGGNITGNTYDTIGISTSHNLASASTFRGSSNGGGGNAPKGAKNAKDFLSKYKGPNTNGSTAAATLPSSANQQYMNRASIEVPHQPLLVDGKSPRNSGESSSMRTNGGGGGGDDDDDTGNKKTGGSMFSSWFSSSSKAKQEGFQKLKDGNTHAVIPLSPTGGGGGGMGDEDEDDGEYFSTRGKRTTTTKAGISSGIGGGSSGASSRKFGNASSPELKPLAPKSSSSTPTPAATSSTKKTAPPASKRNNLFDDI